MPPSNATIDGAKERSASILSEPPRDVLDSDAERGGGFAAYARIRRAGSRQPPV